MLLPAEGDLQATVFFLLFLAYFCTKAKAKMA